MKGYHYLMRIGHALNVLAQYSESLINVVRAKVYEALLNLFVKQSLLQY
jgi:hypothetical protein